MQPHITDSTLLPEAGVAALGVVVLFYAWRGLSGVPLLPRLLIGLVVGGVVSVSFGLVILALSPAGGLPWEAQRREAAVLPGPASGPAPRSFPAPPSPVPASPAPAPPEIGADAPSRPAAAPPAVAAVAEPVAKLPAAEMPAPPPFVAPSREASDGSIEIFYGTDRARVASSAAVAYSAARGQRLEVGRATVAVAAAAGTGSDAPAAAAVASSLAALSPDAFAQLASARLSASRELPGRAVVFVHGYNTSLETAVADAGRFARGMGLDGPAFVYAWPSASTIASYSYDATSAGEAGRFVTEFLALVAARTGARDISVVALDMGAEPALAALAELPGGVAVKEVVLFAPDADAAQFGSRVEALARRAHVTLYATANWRALAVSRRFNGGRKRAGEVAADGPVVVSGIDTIEAAPEAPRDAGPSGLGRAVVADWSALVRTGAAAAARTAGGLERVPLKSGHAYWRLRPPGG
jgi:esterase/lipase superfamily enzyme